MKEGRAFTPAEAMLQMANVATFTATKNIVMTARAVREAAVGIADAAGESKIPGMKEAVHLWTLPLRNILFTNGKRRYGQAKDNK